MSVWDKRNDSKVSFCAWQVHFALGFHRAEIFTTPRGSGIRSLSAHQIGKGNGAFVECLSDNDSFEIGQFGKGGPNLPSSSVVTPPRGRRRGRKEPFRPFPFGPEDWALSWLHPWLRPCMNDPADSQVHQASGKVEGGDCSGFDPPLGCDETISGVNTHHDSFATSRLIREPVHSGSAQAQVPMITRSRPRAKARSIESSSRMPPPNCTFSPSTSKIDRTASKLAELPEKAASKSTAWR